MNWRKFWFWWNGFPIAIASWFIVAVLLLLFLNLTWSDPMDVSDNFLNELRSIRDSARNECDDELERLAADLLRYLEITAEERSDGR